jgi:tRNA A-37 threonylcarbamoyl transferase component Bud32
MPVPEGILFGRYQVVGILGRGATSIVYRAEDPKTRNTFAIKALREELLVDEERDTTLRRFHREAAIGRDLSHPRIARLYDVGESKGLPWLAFEFVAGESLDLRLRRAPMPPSQVAILGIDLLDALAYAHSRNIVHRDLKPANVMLRGTKMEPVLMDFGIAKVDGSALTLTGEVLGSPAYVAPEVLRGEGADHRSDLFALGVLLYQAVTGCRPFDGTVAEVLHRICHLEPLPPSVHLPQAACFDAVLARAMIKQPDARFPSANAFAEALRALTGVIDTSDQPGRYFAAALPAVSESSLCAVDLRIALSENLGREITPIGLGRLKALIARVPPAEGAVAANAVLAEGIRPLVIWLAETAPDPQRIGGTGGDWLIGAEVMESLQLFLQGLPEWQEAHSAILDLAQDLAARALLFTDSLGRRLAAADDAPDLQEIAFAFLNLDALCFGLDILGADRERWLAEASSSLAVAGVLRMAASLMHRYVATRDPLIRFDVLNLLLRCEDLIGLAGRLLEPPPGKGRSVVALGKVGEEALSALISAITALVDAIGQELVVAATDSAGIDETLARLRQLQLVHRFASRLDAAIFHQALADLSMQVHDLFVRLGGVLLSMPDDTHSRHRIGVLQNMAAELGWHDLARRLLSELSRRVVALPAPSIGGSA